MTIDYVTSLHSKVYNSYVRMLIFLAYVSFPVLGLMACFDMTCLLNYFYGGFSVASVKQLVADILQKF